MLEGVFASLPTEVYTLLIPSLGLLILGFSLDRWWGDPRYWPHLVVGFGCAIAFIEKRCNRGSKRLLKGGVMAVLLILTAYFLSWSLLYVSARYSIALSWVLGVLLIFSCLAGRTLEREVRAVFDALRCGLTQGRQRLSRIVGRNTEHLDAEQVRTAALESLAENLSDGVVAPLFWYGILGTPGMVAYKMVNTLDSMVGYRNERYLYYGRLAAYIDDWANFLPARLTAYLILCNARGGGRWCGELTRQGPQHESPNAGWPEAAMALVLNCQFGGPTLYGESMLVDKAYLGTEKRTLTDADGIRAIIIARRVAWCALFICGLIRLAILLLLCFWLGVPSSLV